MRKKESFGKMFGKKRADEKKRASERRANRRKRVAKERRGGRRDVGAALLNVRETLL